MKIAGRTQMLSHRMTVDETMRFFRDAGFAGVELCLEDYHFNLRPDLTEPYVIEHIVGLAQELGLPIMAVSNHMRYTYDDFSFESIKKAIPLTSRYGAGIFIISSMVDPAQTVRDPQVWDTTVNRIREMVAVAESCGIAVAVEPEPLAVIADTEDFIRLCDAVGSDRLLCNFDIGHAFLTDDDVCESIGRLGDRICHCHVENMRKGQHMHLPPWQGDIDLPAVFRKLKSIGYAGGMSLDLYHYPYDEVAGNSVAALRRMLDD